MSDENDDNVIRVQFGAPAAPPAPRAEDYPESNAEKLELFSEMVEKGTVLVTLDARRDGVVVPRQFTEEMRLNLNFCHQFGILDFDYDVAGVRASLSFGGVDFFCDIPWTSVWIMRSHVQNDGYMFPADIPEELMGDPQAPAEEE